MQNLNTRFIAEIGIFTAVGLVLDFIGGLYSGFFWPNGGSLSFAMVAIIIMAFRWGLKGGITTGVLVGTIQILWSTASSRVHPIQIILDYPVAYGLIGLIGIFAKKITISAKPKNYIYITIGILLVGLLRTSVHIFTGTVYFLVPLIGSITYNITYMFPSIILCILLTIGLVRRVPYFSQLQ